MKYLTNIFCVTQMNVLPQDEGVDINLLDGDDATPLHFAASRGHSDTVSTDILNHRYTLCLCFPPFAPRSMSAQCNLLELDKYIPG